MKIEVMLIEAMTSFRILSCWAAVYETILDMVEIKEMEAGTKISNNEFTSN